MAAPLTYVGSMTEGYEGKRMGMTVGSFSFRDGSRYDGEYVRTASGKHVRQGKGKWINGREEYQGEWWADTMHGRGRYICASGARYEGDFKHNRFDGQGSYRWPDGSTYIGQWKDNSMNGRGVYTSRDRVHKKGMFTRGRYYDEITKSYVSLRHLQQTITSSPNSSGSSSSTGSSDQSNSASSSSDSSSSAIAIS